MPAIGRPGARCRPALAGCAVATTVEQAVPTASTTPVSGISTGAPKNTGTFPNLNIKPQVATDADLAGGKAGADRGNCAPRSSSRRPPAAAGKAPTNPVLLRKLAATHADDALKEIEGEK